MPKKVTITVYEIRELEGAALERAALERAESIIEARLLESFAAFVGESWASFCEAVPGDSEPVTWGELPEADYIQDDFRQEYRYHGARRGEQVRRAFSEFLNSYCEAYGSDDIAEEADANGDLFHSDGRLFRE